MIYEFFCGRKGSFPAYITYATNGFTAINVNTGVIVWQNSIYAPHTMLADDGNNLYLIDYNTIYAVGPKTGKQRWQRAAQPTSFTRGGPL